MNIVVHMTPCTPHSTVASARVARFIVNTLMNRQIEGPDFILVDKQYDAMSALTLYGDHLNTLFIVNGPMAFCDFLEPLAELVRKARKVVFVQQDYTIMPPGRNSRAESPFRKVFADLDLRPDFWTTVKKNIQTPQDKYINWNMLTWDPQPFKSLEQEVPTLMYYGAYREKREPMFRKYFWDTPYVVDISTTTLRGKKFKTIASGVNIVSPFSGLANMPPCRASLYIEDPLSSKEFHSPANRFYELLSAGIPIFFDKGSLPMLAEAGIMPMQPWVVDGKEELYRKMYHYDMDQMRKDQRTLWASPYVARLQERLLKIWNEHKENV